MATKSKALVPAKGTAVVDYSKILADLASRQSKTAATLSAGSAFASIKGGQLVINGGRVPNDRANIIVLSVMQERAFYADAYDPDTPAAPACYAYGEVNGGAPEAPHEKSPDPQSDNCRGCPNAEYGSARVGKGQACRQMQRIAFVAADGKTEAESAIVQLKIPPTSLKNVKGWLDEIGAMGLATPQVVTEVLALPDAKTQVQVQLRVTGEVKQGVLQVIVPRIAVAEKMMQEPYPEFDEAPKPAAKKAKRKF